MTLAQSMREMRRRMAAEEDARMGLIESRAWQRSQELDRRRYSEQQELDRRGYLEEQQLETEKRAREQRLLDEARQGERRIREAGLLSAMEAFGAGARDLGDEEYVAMGQKIFGPTFVEEGSLIRNAFDATRALSARRAELEATGKTPSQIAAAGGMLPGQLEETRAMEIDAAHAIMYEILPAGADPSQVPVIDAVAMMVDAGYSQDEATDIVTQARRLFPAYAAERLQEDIQRGTEFERGMADAVASGILLPEEAASMKVDRLHVLAGTGRIGTVPYRELSAVNQRAATALSGLGIVSQMANLIVDHPDAVGAPGRMREILGGVSANVGAAFGVFDEAFGGLGGTLASSFEDMVIEASSESGTTYDQARDEITRMVSAPGAEVGFLGFGDPQISNMKLLELLLAFKAESAVTGGRRFSIQAVNEIAKRVDVQRAQGGRFGLIKRLESVEGMFAGVLEGLKNEERLLELAAGPPKDGFPYIMGLHERPDLVNWDEILNRAQTHVDSGGGVAPSWGSPEGNAAFRNLTAGQGE